MKLSAGILDDLPAGVGRPRYDRSAVTIGIVHFGVGGFHRAHQAMVLDELMNGGEALNWGICGVGVLPGDARMRDTLRAQDHLYTLVEKNADGSRAIRVIGSIVDYRFAPDEPSAVADLIAAPTTRVVSLTVTEGGYNVDQVTGEFDLAQPEIASDLRGSSPRTVFGLVVEGLRRRRAAGAGPLTIMSCDNIRGNGHVARGAFLAFARAADPELAAWIEAEIAFPNSMVDRITPVTTDQDRDDLAARTGIEDAWPVVCEPFFQWVLEDAFAAGRPPVEHAGVQVVDDVEPYELMKLRLLNASHQGMCYFGYLAGYRYAHEAAGDPALRRFLRRYMDEEATPTLLPVLGIDLDAYKSELISRFRNPEIRDTLARLCAESSDRIPQWLLPVVRANLVSGGPVRLSASIVASWARYAEGIDEKGEPIRVVDRLADQIVPIARARKDDELAFLRQASLFGELVNDSRFTDAYRAALASLVRVGAARTFEDLAG